MSNLSKRLLACLCIMLFPALPPVSAKQIDPIDSKDFCASNYFLTAYCPPELCELKCQKGTQGSNCALGCQPLPCHKISAEYCPENYCQVIEGCDEEEETCTARYTDEPADCGPISYSGNLECCDGLEKRCGVEYFDGSCLMTGENTVYNVPVCLPCGNGICNQFENRCNCPEDCAKN